MVERLYYLREELAQKGIRKPITVLVREAIDEYLKRLKEPEEEIASG